MTRTVSQKKPGLGASQQGMGSVQMRMYAAPFVQRSSAYGRLAFRGDIFTEPYGLAAA